MQLPVEIPNFSTIRMRNSGAILPVQLALLMAPFNPAVRPYCFDGPGFAGALHKKKLSPNRQKARAQSRQSN